MSDSGCGVAIGVIVVVILIGTQKLQADREQSTANAAYRGPTFAPSLSPGSPVDGYRLRSVKLPSPFDANGGATQISLSCIRPAAEISDEKGYTIDFRVGQHALLCGDEFPVCPTVGTALGRPVLHITNADSCTVPLDSGVILLEGDLDPDQAVSILTDLKKASVEEIAALPVDVR